MTIINRHGNWINLKIGICSQIIKDDERVKKIDRINIKTKKSKGFIKFCRSLMILLTKQILINAKRQCTGPIWKGMVPGNFGQDE